MSDLPRGISIRHKLLGAVSFGWYSFVTKRTRVSSVSVILMQSPSSYFFSRRNLSIAVLSFVAVVSALGQSKPVDLRYKLSPGDRLVYRQSFDREGKSPDSSFHTHLTFLSQIVVLDPASDGFIIGVQRNRQSAELLESTDHGVDNLAKSREGFAQIVAKRPAHFSDTNLYSATGQPLLPIQVLREAISKLLYGVGEIMPVPAAPMQIGSEWELGTFGLRLKLDHFEPVGEESCALITDTGARKDTHL